MVSKKKNGHSLSDGPNNPNTLEHPAPVFTIRQMPEKFLVGQLDYFPSIASAGPPV